MTSDITSKSLRDTSDFGHVTVTLNVGSDKFAVHKDLLVKHAHYFGGAFNRDFKEAHDREVTLQDVSLQTVRHFIEWLYFERLPMKSKELSSALTNVEEPLQMNQPPLRLELLAWNDKIVDLAIFADRFQAPVLAECVLLSWHSHWTSSPNVWFPGSERVEKILRNFPKGSPMRKFVVDLVAGRFSRGEPLKQLLNSTDADPDFHKELVERLMELRSVKARTLPGFDRYRTKSVDRRS